MGGALASGLWAMQVVGRLPGPPHFTASLASPDLVNKTKDPAQTAPCKHASPEVARGIVL